MKKILSILIIIFLLFSCKRRGDNNLSSIFKSCEERDKLILLKFAASIKDSTIFISFGSKYFPQFEEFNLMDIPLKGWSGIKVNYRGCVVSIEYDYLDNLEGELIPELGNLDCLESLTIKNAKIYGKIPPELGKLTNLKNLILPGNNLSGPIPPELGNLTNLEHLDLYSNNLSGQLPQELNNLRNLKLIYLDGNKELNGIVPKKLCNIQNLYIENTGLKCE